VSDAGLMYLEEVWYTISVLYRSVFRNKTARSESSVLDATEHIYEIRRKTTDDSAHYVSNL
jgi:hypothetical protein